MSIPFHFHHGKAAQAAATLLRTEPSRKMNHYRLLKLLYIADRQCLQETGRPMIGGRLVAMKRGPLHSTLHDLIHGSAPNVDSWSRFFQTTTHEREVIMLEDPGNDDLTESEIDILSRVRDQNETRDDFEVGELTHEFREFMKNKPTQEPFRIIPFEDVVEAVCPQRVEQIFKDAATKALFDRTFGA